MSESVIRRDQKGSFPRARKGSSPLADVAVARTVRLARVVQKVPVWFEWIKQGGKGSNALLF